MFNAYVILYMGSNIATATYERITGYPESRYSILVVLEPDSDFHFPKNWVSRFLDPSRSGI